MTGIFYSVFAFFDIVGQNRAEQGMFLLGCVLGFMIAYWIHSRGVDGKGLSAVIAVIVGVSLITSLYELGLLWGYGTGIFVGFVANLIIRGIGFVIGGRMRKVSKKLSYNPDIKLTKEIIRNYKRLGEIFNVLYERAGGSIGVPDIVRIDPEEEREFRDIIDWLCMKYPLITKDTSRALRTEYYSRAEGVHIPNYDPILQIIQTSSLRDVMSIGKASRFKRDWEAGRARLLAYQGLIENG